MLIARGLPAIGLEGIGAALPEPPVDVVVVELLGPEHAGQSLAHHGGGVGIERPRDDRSVELVGLAAPGLSRGIEAAAEGGGQCRVVEPQADGPLLAGRPR